MFNHLDNLPPDPILGLTQAYKNDQNPLKVDLGAGIYKNDVGQTPIMQAIQQAQKQWMQEESTKAYAPPVGIGQFPQAIIELLLGKDHASVKESRVISVQTPGGCGALRVAAGLLTRCKDNVRIWVSAPTWANHIPLLSSAGIELVEYPYYDFDNHGINFEAMMDSLQQANEGDLVLVHGCCHNPSGADLSQDQWRQLATLFNEKHLTPFVDVAYQGLGDGLEEDAWGLRYLAEQCPEVIIASSCSKNFGLYRERVGAVLVVAETQKAAEASRGQLLNIAREIYSMPPSHGAALVDIILHDDNLATVWKKELTEMRERISGLRTLFSEKLSAAGFGDKYQYIQKEKGMFSFLGINPDQVSTLVNEYSIYLVGSSRINVAGLSETNVDYVVDSLKAIS